MRFSLFLQILFVSTGICLQANAQNNKTYYYERVAIVKNGTKQAASGDGHYLTFNNKILYESNEKGLSKQTSSVTYINSDNNRPLYEGNTTLGNNLSYVFNSDYSRLNVRELSGTVYVYERKSNPSPSKMRVYETHISSPVIVVDDYEPASSSSVNSRTSRNRQNKKQKVTCTRCNGTKYIDKYVPSVSEFGVKKPEYYDCHICGKRVAKNGGHGHSTCPNCHGVGYVYK